MQKDMAQQLAKLQEQLSKRENEKQQQLQSGNQIMIASYKSVFLYVFRFATAQAERKGIQDKLSACAAELESERKELARVRREEAELQNQHTQSVENFRSEISRLHEELRAAGSVLALSKLLGKIVNDFVFNGESGKAVRKRCRRPNKFWL